MPPAPAQAPKKKFATLGDIRGGAGPSHAGHGHDDDDDDDDDFQPSDDDNQNLYAGGEKSGLAVENPDDLKKKILERAKKLVSHEAVLKTLLTTHSETSRDQVVMTPTHLPPASPAQLALSAATTPPAK